MPGTNTQEKLDTFRQGDDHNEHDALPTTWAETVDMYRDQLLNPLFIDSLTLATEERGEYDVDQEIATGIEDWVSENRDIFGDKLSTRLTLMAQAPLQVHHSETIQHYQQERVPGRRLPDEQWAHLNWCKLQTVQYNQLLNNYMYENTDDSFSKLRTGLIGPTLDAFPGHENKNIVERTLTNTLRGARYESVTRQALDQIGVDYRLPTPAEDMRGSDIFVMGQGVDIKSSLDQVVSDEDAYDAGIESSCRVLPSRNPGQKPRILFWPGINERSLQDSLAWKGEANTVIPFFVQLNNAIKASN